MPDLTEDEKASVLSSARKLKQLGVDVTRVFDKMARTETAVSPHFPFRWEPAAPDRPEMIVSRQVDAGELATVLQTVHAGLVDIDALYSPTVLEQLFAMRTIRAYLGIDREPGFWRKGDLDRTAKAIALRSLRGRRSIPIEVEVQDRFDYGVYIRVLAALAEETQHLAPESGVLGSAALFELASSREQFEPHFSQQLAAYWDDRSKPRVPLNNRAALVLLGLVRKRRGDFSAVVDDDLTEALANLERLKKSLTRFRSRRAAARS